MVSTDQSSSRPNTPPQAATARESTDYAPANPSRLRESHNLSSEEMSTTNSAAAEHMEEHPSLGARILGIFRGGPQQQGAAESSSRSGMEEVTNTGEFDERTSPQPDARTRLLESYNRDFACGTTECGHGTFSPKATPSSGSNSVSSFQGIEGPTEPSGSSQNDGIGDGPGRSERGGMSASRMLAKKHGVKNTRRM